MKTLLAFAIGLLVLFSIISCDNNQENVKPDPISKNGTPTEVGKPTGTLTGKMIGPQGGTISTPDGKLTLTFPVGALTKETNITIQPVENKAWNGVGVGYEFGPDGSEFAKPVTFTYRYTDKEISGVATETMGLAFQDQNKVWKMTAPLTVNKSQKTITGSISHFSWWSMVTRYRLLPEYDTVQIGEYRELQLEHLDIGFEWPWWEGKSTSENPEFSLLVPLNEPKLADRTDIAKLYLNGVDWTTITPKDQSSGSLGHASNGKKAVIIYTAPSKKPTTNNPVSVSVELSHSGKAKLMLVSTLLINNENTLSVDGSDMDDVVINAGAGGGYLAISIEDNAANILQIHTTNFKLGAYAFNTENTYIGAVNTGKKKSGSSMYEHCRETRTEAGTLVIEKIYKSDGQTKMKGRISGTVCTDHQVDEKCNVIVHKTMKVNATFTTVVRM